MVFLVLNATVLFGFRCFGVNETNIEAFFGAFSRGGRVAVPSKMDYYVSCDTRFS